MANKNILVGVCGGVAIYKTLSLIRLLKKNDYDIQVIMTENATKLINPQLFSSISGNFVRTKTFDDTTNKIVHIDLSRWADLIVVVPATANIIGKLANGIADDLLSTMLMGSNKQIMIAPAMNTEMYNSLAFQRNLKQIKSDGVIVIDSCDGSLACGESGKGRMEEPENIFGKIDKYFHK
ncbi:MAG: phosphopantothenoylcysteine decarboxylase [Rickettsiales bacterium]|jgi:phosphopantothenoylcysteine decarboxylase/phosphopantothenate--cysteine ligase|nr:phosphopantothenoylcysteine decarboxylase [Rickettsiales bacterium]